MIYLVNLMFIIKYNFTYMQVIHTIMAQIHNRGKKKTHVLNSLYLLYEKTLLC